VVRLGRLRIALEDQINHFRTFQRLFLYQRIHDLVERFAVLVNDFAGFLVALGQDGVDLCIQTRECIRADLTIFVCGVQLYAARDVML